MDWVNWLFLYGALVLVGAIGGAWIEAWRKPWTDTWRKPR